MNPERAYYDSPGYAGVPCVERIAEGGLPGHEVIRMARLALRRGVPHSFEVEVLAAGSWASHGHYETGDAGAVACAQEALRKIQAQRAREGDAE